MQVTGDAVHPGRLLHDALEEVSQSGEVAAGLSVGTDRGTGHAQEKMRQCRRGKRNCRERTESKL